MRRSFIPSIQVIVKSSLLLTALLLFYYLFSTGSSFNQTVVDYSILTANKTILDIEPSPKVESLPQESSFQLAAQSNDLQLLVDPQSGHFMVVHTKTQHIWRSYPDPDHLPNETVTGLWADHLKSPLFFRYIQFDVRRDQVRESNLIHDHGSIKDFEIIDNGFRLTFDIPQRGLSIPVQVTLRDDYVETKIIDEDLIEQQVNLSNLQDDTLRNLLQEGKEVVVSSIRDQDTIASVQSAVQNVSSLISVRLYPFFGAEHSTGQDGYIFIPDGSGALIRFYESRPNALAYYDERIYGDDLAFSFKKERSQRKSVKMPLFGMKTDNRAFLGHVYEGAEYARIIAAPAGSFSLYNWSSVEMIYRSSYFQPTSTDKQEGFTTFNRDRFKTDRITRYYLLSDEQADYSGMASRYREFLINETGLQPLENTGKDISLHITLLGGDLNKGFLRNNYLPVTTTKQAEKIIGKLAEKDVQQMSITYMGWQQNGFSSLGGAVPFENRLGGNSGLQQFVQFAHQHNSKVYLAASMYSYNNTGKDGFSRRRDGLRDLGGSIIEYKRDLFEDLTFVSPLFAKKLIDRDLKLIDPWGVDGLLFGGSIGSHLNSDYNDKYAINRSESRKLQEEIMSEAKNSLGDLLVSSSNFYALNHASHIDQLYDDYSYDVFVDHSIPFAQMTLHGLITYSANFGNERDDYVKGLLRTIEYGALPHYALSYAEALKIKNTLGFSRFFSTNYADWLDEIVTDYHRLNEALGDVQDQFIVRHEQLVEGVNMVTYSGGKQIIVNYTNDAYITANYKIEALDYIVLGGGLK
jgi:hypothetical protein